MLEPSLLLKNLRSLACHLTMKHMLSLLKKNEHRITAIQPNKKKLLEWIQSDPNRRQFELLSVRQLKELAKSKRISGISNLNKDGIIEKLIKKNSERENNEMSDAEIKKLSPLIAFLDCSLLRPLKDKIERDAATTGHQNEQPFILQFVDQCLAVGREAEYEHFPFSSFGIISSVYRPGLVRKKNVPFAKGSADGIIIRNLVSSTTA